MAVKPKVFLNGYDAVQRGFKNIFKVIIFLNLL